MPTETVLARFVSVEVFTSLTVVADKCQYWGTAIRLWRPKVPANLCIDEIYLLFLFNINTCVPNSTKEQPSDGGGGNGNGNGNVVTVRKVSPRKQIVLIQMATAPSENDGDARAHLVWIVCLLLLLILIPWWPSRHAHACHAPYRKYGRTIFEDAGNWTFIYVCVCVFLVFASSSDDDDDDNSNNGPKTMSRHRI